MKIRKISILTPAYQNEDNIQKLISDIYQNVVISLRKMKIEPQVVIAEDGSTDNTRSILKKNRRKYGFRLLLGKKKLGYIRAVKNLFAEASGDLIFFLDSDGEINPKSFWDLFKVWRSNRSDIVTAYKIKRRPIYRFIISKINNFFINVLFKTGSKDANAGFRLYKKKVGKKLVSESGYLKYNFNSEQIIRAVKNNLKIKQVGVTHFVRKSVVFNPKKLIFLLPKALFELFMFRIKMTNQEVKRQ